MSGSGSSQSSSDISHLLAEAANNPVDRNTRLPSIRRPRDLTLGAPPKLQFVPNIPVRRGKKIEAKLKKEPEVLNKASSSSFPLKCRQSKAFPRQYIQTPGSVFGEAKLTPIKKGTSAQPGVSNKSKIVPKTQADKKTTKVKTKEKDGNLKTSKSAKHEAKCSSTSSSDFSDVDEDVYNSNDEPNVVPLGLALEKVEISDECSTATKFPSVPDFLTHLENSEKDELILLEFPNSFYSPFESVESNGEFVMRNLATESYREMLSKQEEPFETLPEGLIGKIQVLRNGKTRFVAGSSVYDEIRVENSSPMLQQVVSVDKDKGTVNVLGNLQHKLQFMLDIKDVIGKREREF